ncbi:MAG: hypothetical protein H3C50_07460 [Kiritimatiellae bacterium]|nr:hypothetical protein [Kiritimatiellia bacterium]MCO5067612.1 hypothetical protein [Kiritimatiellia bacterium]
MRTISANALPLVATLLIATAVGQAIYFANRMMRVAREPGESAPSIAASVQERAAPLSQEEWLQIQTATRPTESSGPLAERFRLAGTFFLYSDASENDPEQEHRRAIVDDLAAKTQVLVRENQEIDGYLVTRIEEDRVHLLRDGTEYELTLSFSPVSAALASTQPEAKPAENVSMEDMPALETSRFGKRVGENRWVMKREELLRYYSELLEDPERIANVYASLKPEYKENEIQGYYLDTEGEGDLFRAIGLQEGDVIRRVNSMRMVSQRRAEYFITEFMKNRVNALVFDVERGGTEQKMIYLIR